MTAVLVTADGKKRPLRLGALLNRGGVAGAIYADGQNSNLVVKVYHTPDLARGHAAKIWSMLKRAPDLPHVRLNNSTFAQIAWPEEAALDKNGQVIGFSMPKIEFGNSVDLESLLHKTSRRVENLQEGQNFRLVVARNIAAIFAELHKLGHYVIDAKPINIRIYRESAYSALLDCDGFSVCATDGTRFPASHFTEGYIAPEALGLTPGNLGVSQDLFALATIIFQLLNNGLHPFQGALRPGKTFEGGDLQTRINGRSWPYGKRDDEYQLPKANSLHEYFHPQSSVLFQQAFAASSRPTAAAWRDHLHQLISDAKVCKKNQDHLIFAGMCGACAVGSKAQKTVPRPPTQPPIQMPYRPPPAPQRTSFSDGKKWLLVGAGVLGLWWLSSLGDKAKPTISTTSLSPSSSGPSSNLRTPAVVPTPSPQVAPSPPPAGLRDTPAGRPVSLEPHNNAELVAKANLNVREQPNDTARIVDTIPAGTSFDVLGRVSSLEPMWLKIQNGSRSGFVAAGYTQTRKEWAEANKVVGVVSNMPSVSKVVIGNRTLQLNGIVPAPEIGSQRMMSWLDTRGRSVECLPVRTEYTCFAAGNLDVAHAAILNGLAMATPDAPSAYTQAEASARNAKRGHWARN